MPKNINYFSVRSFNINLPRPTKFSISYVYRYIVFCSYLMSDNSTQNSLRKATFKQNSTSNYPKYGASRRGMK